jgi:acyl phosphate:glycerol-3-phosphate acyltransferase
VDLLLCAVLTGYLLGSIPTAYVLVRWRSGIDLQHAGSGNVGALNSFEVTRSRAVGLSVLVLDLLKGVAAVLAGRWIGGDAALAPLASALAAVLGHNFPVWLGFKGGRGLATAAGASLLVFWGLVPAWCILWALAFAIVRSVNPASTVACLASAAIVILYPGLLPGVAAPDAALIPWFVTILMILILSRLIGPTWTFIQEQRAKRRLS